MSKQQSSQTDGQRDLSNKQRDLLVAKHQIERSITDLSRQINDIEKRNQPEG